MSCRPFVTCWPTVASASSWQGSTRTISGKPFEPMPQLLAIAEYITKTLAICVVCGNPANHTQRLVASGDRVLVGAQGVYEARCRAVSIRGWRTEVVRFNAPIGTEGTCRRPITHVPEGPSAAWHPG